ANPRSEADRKDSAAIAANELAGERFRTVDLTDFYCDRRRCYPVIGGVLVYADGNHQSPQWNQTLAPFLLRAVERDGWLLPPPDRGNG
ncbi:MAG: SGNH hydrolase domain-containing protein, partial [Solirubrobacterales bacterium]